MSLTIGTQLGAYEIVEPIGAGGFGQVYKARDIRLNRFVAIKVLPEHLSQDPGLKARFEREAQTLASLSHPHICPIFDVGQQDGIDFIVMEFLEGATLAERLQKGALPLDEALKIAVEIADALDKAHGDGVIHRDVKPSNVMLTKSGAKLLDFGLAKLKPLEPMTAFSAMPTRADITAQGTILGTLQYMAPEQLEGQDADARTDIFTFGALVYEMLTGRKAFEGKSQSSLIAAIMHIHPPNLSHVQPLTPPVLDHIVQKCLQKDPEQRWQNMRDLHSELAWVREGGANAANATTVEASPKPKRWQQPLALALAVCITALISIAVVWNVRPSNPLSVTRSVIAVPSGVSVGQNGSLAFSPDGKQLVYSSGRQLYLRSLDSFDAKPIPGAEGNNPFFSPDGQWIGFFTGQQLKKVSIHGGAPIVLCAAIGNPSSASWAPNGLIVFAPAQGNRGLFQVPDSGGTPEVLAKVDIQKAERYFWPEILPDGNSVAFTVQSESSSTPAQLVAQSLMTGERRVLIQGATMGRYLSSGHLVYMNEGSLMAVRFDASRLQVTGTPVPT